MKVYSVNQPFNLFQGIPPHPVTVEHKYKQGNLIIGEPE